MQVVENINCNILRQSILLNLGFVHIPEYLITLDPPSVDILTVNDQFYEILPHLRRK